MQLIDISIKKLSEENFYSMKAEWDQLLNKSSADKLFMSWEWLSAWWETWGNILKGKLLLLAVYKDSTLIALAPFYVYRRKLRGGIVVKEIHFIGNASRIVSTVRTEYVDLILDKKYIHTSAKALQEYLFKECEWDLIAISDQEVKSKLNNFEILAARLNLMPFIRNKDMGICINTGKNYTQWLNSLGPNTRLKAYNRREYLLKNYSDVKLSKEESYETALEQLNNFHEQRWGQPCFINESMEFHHRFLGKVKDLNQVAFSMLEVNGNKISILYDVLVNNKIYNLQAGFDETFDKKISPGTMHLGYAIESAFKGSHIAEYDLLAGSGKKTFYKSRFKGDEVYFRSSHYIKSWWLKSAVNLYKIIPVRLSKKLIYFLD